MEEYARKRKDRGSKEKWILSQIKFLDERLATEYSFKNTIFKRPKSVFKFLNNLAQVFFYTAVICGVTLFSLNSLQITDTIDVSDAVNYWVMLLGVQFMLVFTASISLWVELSGYNNTVTGYETLRELYYRALVIISKRGNDSQIRSMLLDLAREAMYEHVTWSKYESECDLKRKS